MARRRGKLSNKRKTELRAKRLAERERYTQYDNDDQVLTFDQWCRLNNFSTTTGKRVLGSGACRYVKLSAKRKGITIRDNREYQQSRSHGGE
jgi:hypothetical protein